MKGVFYNILQKTPFLRLLIPLIVGICSATFFESHYSLFLEHYASLILYIGGAILLISLVLLLLFAFIRLSLSKEWLYGIIQMTCCLLIGIESTLITLVQLNKPWPDKIAGYTATISDTPQERKNTWFASSTINTINEEGTYHNTTNRKVHLYLHKDSFASPPQLGDDIHFAAKITRPRNQGNPEEFNYARYLLYNKIEGTAYLPDSTWSLYNTSSLSLFQRIKIAAKRERTRLLEEYKRRGLENNEYAIVAAMTLGDKSSITPELRELYAAAGASHILAL